MKKRNLIATNALINFIRELVAKRLKNQVIKNQNFTYEAFNI